MERGNLRRGRADTREDILPGFHRKPASHCTAASRKPVHHRKATARTLATSLFLPPSSRELRFPGLLDPLFLHPPALHRLPHQRVRSRPACPPSQERSP